MRVKCEACEGLSGEGFEAGICRAGITQGHRDRDVLDIDLIFAL